MAIGLAEAAAFVVDRSDVVVLAWHACIARVAYAVFAAKLLVSCCEQTFLHILFRFDSRLLAVVDFRLSVICSLPC